MSEDAPKPGKRGPHVVSAWTPTRPLRRGAAPASLAEVLVGAQDYMAKRSGSAIPRDEWRQIVGPRIAARTRVGKMWKGVLTIKVASSAWGNELSFLKTSLIEKLRMAGRDVNDLRFVVKDSGMSSRPQRRRAPIPGKPASPPHDFQLPQDLAERLSRVEDPNLRAAIAEAARWSLKKSST